MLFWCLKKKFHCLNGIRTWDLQQVIKTIYCCIIIHNMAVVERVATDAEDVKSASFYDVVEDNANQNQYFNDDNEFHAVNSVQDNVNHRVEQVEYLKALGIHVHDCSLHADSECIRILPQLTRMAEHRWGRFYDAPEHQKLTCALMQQLIINYSK
jgi:hypothetical protein